MRPLYCPSPDILILKHCLDIQGYCVLTHSLGGTLDTKVRLRPDKYKDGIQDAVRPDIDTYTIVLSMTVSAGYMLRFLLVLPGRTRSVITSGHHPAFLTCKCF